MASNPLIDPGPSPSLSVGTEEIAGVQYPFTKLIDATVGSTSPIGTSANPLPVTDSSTSTRKVKGETAVGGAVGDPVPIGTRDLATNTVQVPHTFNFGGVQYLLALVPDPALNFVSYTSSGEQYALTASTDSTKANSRYVRVSTAGNPLVAGDVDHDAADSGNPIKFGGKASTVTPTAVASGDRVNAYFDTTGYQHVKVDGNVSTTTSKGLGFATPVLGGEGFLGDEGGYPLIGSDGANWNYVTVDSGGNLATSVNNLVSASVSNPAPSTTTGNLTSTASVTAAISGQATAVVQISGTYSATLAWEVSFDGSNYYGFSAKRVDTEALETTTGALVNTTRAWEMSICGATNLRMRCTTYVSGTVAVRIQTHHQGTDPSVVATVVGTPTILLPPSSRSDTYTAAANGTTVTVTDRSIKYFAIQCKGTAAGATAWSIVLEGSLDGTNFTTIATHATADLDGTVKNVSAAFPVNYFRSRCASITLGGATNVVTTILGVQ